MKWRGARRTTLKQGRAEKIPRANKPPTPFLQNSLLSLPPFSVRHSAPPSLPVSLFFPSLCQSLSPIPPNRKMYMCICVFIAYYLHIRVTHIVSIIFTRDVRFAVSTLGLHDKLQELFPKKTINPYTHTHTNPLKTPRHVGDVFTVRYSHFPELRTKGVFLGEVCVCMCLCNGVMFGSRRELETRRLRCCCQCRNA